MKYSIFNIDTGELIGVTGSQAEANAYMAQATGCRLESETHNGSPLVSTLPRIQENPGTPAGDFLRQ